MRKQDLSGQTFNRLTVLREDFSKNRTAWLCVCVCGNESVVTGCDLKGGNVKSCGCLKLEETKKVNTKHGLRKHPLYTVWLGIKDRCLNPKNEYYKDYGGRGIKMSDKWVDSPEAFIHWAKPRWRRGLDIDRIDNDGGYSPDNCRFVSRRRNCLNRRRLTVLNKSGYEGVCWYKKSGKWRSQINIHGKVRHLGYSESLEEAVGFRNKFITDNGLENDYKVQVPNSPAITAGA